MKLFSLFRNKPNEDVRKYLIKISEAFDATLIVASPLITEKVNKWDLENPVLSQVLGYIAGFLDSAYQLLQPKKYDESLIDNVFVDAVERNFKSIPGVATFVRFSRLGVNNGGSVIGGLQDHPAFMKGRMVGGNDFVDFFNNRRAGRPGAPMGLVRLISGETQ